MVRRSFRIGLWIGLVLGVTLALRRTVHLRRTAEHPEISPEPWPPVRLSEERAEAPSPPAASMTFPPVPRSETAPVAEAAFERLPDERPPLEEAVAEELSIEQHLETAAETANQEIEAAVEVTDEPVSDERAAGDEDDWSVPEIEEPPAARPARPAKKAGATKATAKKTPRPKKPAMAWVEPKGGACPNSHPIKAKLTSGIFHLPGMFAYDRTNADRCYANAEDAEADGLHRAKR